jgi:hypothetical protein
MASQQGDAYPGTAFERMLNIREKVKGLGNGELYGDWEDVRVNILTAGGLKDLRSAAPGSGYTGHSFNDFNHCDLTAMKLEVSSNNNEGLVQGIAYNNRLGKGIMEASIPELGPGGSWSTCILGSGEDPPQDVAHLQFQSRIAFKLVWSPPEFKRFVLVDDAGDLLARGEPVGGPAMSERRRNYAVVRGSKYAVEAEKFGAE